MTSFHIQPLNRQESTWGEPQLSILRIQMSHLQENVIPKSIYSICFCNYPQHEAQNQKPTFKLMDAHKSEWRACLFWFCCFVFFCRRGTVRCRRGCGGGVRCGDARLQLNKLSSCVIRCYRECVQTFWTEFIIKRSKMVRQSFEGGVHCVGRKWTEAADGGRGNTSQSQTPAGGLGARVPLLPSSRNKFTRRFCFFFFPSSSLQHAAAGGGGSDTC